MKVGDIVTIVATSGEYVGRLESNADRVTLKDPRMIVQNPQDGSMGFAKGVAVTGQESPKVMTFDSYVFMAETNERVATAWTEATSGIVLQSKEIAK